MSSDYWWTGRAPGEVVDPSEVDYYKPGAPAVYYGVSPMSREGRIAIHSRMKSFLYGKYGEDLPHPVSYANHMISDMEEGDYERYNRFGTLDQAKSAWDAGDYNKLADIYIRMYEADYKEYLTVELPEKILEEQKKQIGQLGYIPGKWVVGGSIAAGAISILIIIILLVTKKKKGGEKK